MAVGVKITFFGEAPNRNYEIGRNFTRIGLSLHKRNSYKHYIGNEEDIRFKFEYVPRQHCCVAIC
jgi:hypothetical protein